MGVVRDIKRQWPDCKLYFVVPLGGKFLLDYFPEIEGVMDVRNVGKSIENIQADAILFLHKDKMVAKAAKKAGIALRIAEKGSLLEKRYYNQTVVLPEGVKGVTARAEALVSVGLEIEQEEVGDQEFPKITLPQTPPMVYRGVIKKSLINVVMYPYKEGAERIWPVVNYFELIERLPKHIFNFVVVGTEKEGQLLKQYTPELFRLPSVKDKTGLEEEEEILKLVNRGDIFLSFNQVYTHLSVAAGIETVMMTPPVESRQFAPPNNTSVNILSSGETECIDCTKKKGCTCIKQIEIAAVEEVLLEYARKKGMLEE
ncbi:hypothetical protein GCM10023331_14130 [Algivirga pacifica]|uniref:Glycosyltransferase family 9 protein n=2 Tax=Algivirga pacifica TaxID=1162670 RepID=A0ABP9D693_9BACT